MVFLRTMSSCKHIMTEVACGALFILVAALGGAVVLCVFARNSNCGVKGLFTKDGGGFVESRGDATTWNALKKEPAVSLRSQSWIEYRENSPVGRRADQSSQSLLQRDCGLRNRVLIKRIATLIVNILLPRGDYWIAGHRERQLRDDHA